MSSILKKIMGKDTHNIDSSEKLDKARPDSASKGSKNNLEKSGVESPNLARRSATTKGDKHHSSTDSLKKTSHTHPKSHPNTSEIANGISKTDLNDGGRHSKSKPSESHSEKHGGNVGSPMVPRSILATKSVKIHQNAPSPTGDPHNRAISHDKQDSNKKYGLEDIKIDKTLGTGSFGRVHLVRLKSNDKFYAMKVLRKSDVVRLKQVEHTINERSIMAQLDHPFLIGLLATFQDSNNLYFVLEYIQGGELFSYLRKCGRFANHVARFYAAEVTLGFEYLHEKNIIYRDLKPENLLIDSKGHIRIIDFGFAKVVKESTWTLCGTPDYLAPEIIQSKGYGSACDWWALGILIYEMVAGFPPFYHEDQMKVYEKILECKPKFPSHVRPECKDLVKRFLTTDLTKRFGNLKGGAKDVKDHPWFDGVDWQKLLNLDIAAPFVPPLKGDGDTSNFDSYPEDHEPYGATGPDPYSDKFKGF